MIITILPSLTSTLTELFDSKFAVAQIPAISRFDLALINNNLQEIRFLLADPEFDVNEEVNNMTPLMFVASEGNVPITQMLLAHPETKVDAVNDRGETALHKAVYGEHLEIVEMLLMAGADTEIPDRNGCKPISLARKLGYPEIVRLFNKAFYEKRGIDASETGGIPIQYSSSRRL